MAATITSESKLRNKIKTAIILIIIGLLLNGISAVPLHTELKILLSNPEILPEFLRNWWTYVHEGVRETTKHYGFMRYGFDWLAFAHLLIAIVFIGPLKDPIKNEWIITWGLIVSVLSIIMALGGERLRDIPFWWSCIDAGIAIISFIILWFCNKWIKQLKTITANKDTL
ncbi:MAG: hypothetical protein ABJB05_10795 [Parafilimonas sp.]